MKDNGGGAVGDELCMVQVGDSRRTNLEESRSRIRTRSILISKVTFAPLWHTAA